MSFLFRPFSAASLGRRKPPEKGPVLAATQLARPVELPEGKSVPPCSLPSASCCMLLASHNMPRDMFGRIQDCVETIFSEMDITALPATSQISLIDQAFTSYTWLHILDPALPAEKATEYARTIFTKLVRRTPENYFNKTIPTDERTATEIIAAIQFSRIFNGIRRSQRPDENFNLLLGQISLDEYLPEFYRKEILEPAELFFESHITPDLTSHATFRRFLNPWFNLHSSIARQVVKDIWTEKINRKTTTVQACREYIDFLRKPHTLPERTPFILRYRELSLNREREVVRLMRAISKYREEGLLAFGSHELLDTQTRNDRVSFVFRFKSDLKLACRVLRGAFHHSTEDIIGTMSTLGAEVARILAEEKGPQILQSAIATRNIFAWVLDAATKTDFFIGRYKNEDARPLLTGDARALLAHIDFSRRLPFEEEGPAASHRQNFDLAVWVAQNVAQADYVLEKAAETTTAIIRASKELSSARALFTKTGSGDAIASELWRLVFHYIVKCTGKLEVSNDVLFETLTGKGRIEIWRSMRRPVEEAITKCEVPRNTSSPKM